MTRDIIMKLKYVLLCTLVLAATAMAADPITVGATRTDVISAGAVAPVDASVFYFPAEQFAGKNVDYAAVTVKFVPPADSSGTYVISVHPLRVSWNLSTNWSSIVESPGDFYYQDIAVTAVVSQRNDFTATIDLTELARLWSSGQITNNGVIVVTDTPGEDRAKIDENAPSGGLGPIMVYSSVR
jgi:hypothetical protein